MIKILAISDMYLKTEFCEACFANHPEYDLKVVKFGSDDYNDMREKFHRIERNGPEAVEIPEAVRKGIEDAKRHLIEVPIVGTSIPHAVEGKFGKGHVRMIPAEEGTGVIAGGPARAVLEMAGIKDIRTKSFGSNNPANCVKATIDGLSQLRTVEEIAKLRGKTVEEILG